MRCCRIRKWSVNLDIYIHMEIILDLNAHVSQVDLYQFLKDCINNSIDRDMRLNVSYFIWYFLYFIYVRFIAHKSMTSQCIVKKKNNELPEIFWRLWIFYFVPFNFILMYIFCTTDIKSLCIFAVYCLMNKVCLKISRVVYLVCILLHKKYKSFSKIAHSLYKWTYRILFKFVCDD